MRSSTAVRVVLAKVGLDGHDRGIKVVARGLRDAGLHVIYGGIWQSPEAVAQATLDEDVRWLGISLLNGAHLTLISQVMEALRRRGLDDVGLVLGGIVPPRDISTLHELGVSAVFGPGTAISEIARLLTSSPSREADGAELVNRCRQHDRRALARLLSLIASGEQTDVIRKSLEGCDRPNAVTAEGDLETVPRQLSRKDEFTGATVTESSTWPCEQGKPLLSSHGHVEDSVTVAPQTGQSWMRHVSPCETVPMRARTVAFTGSAGVGKSSLIARLVTELRSRNLTVAVLSCDPQSTVTGGALLGDRIRMSNCLPDEGVFIRSLAVASGSQGIAAHLDLMALALEAFGFDVVLIETAGTGQGDVAVRGVADSLVLLLQPESGDSVQWEKAGLLEIADVIVIHKADLPGADRLESELREFVCLPGHCETKLVRVSAARNEGVRQLWEALSRMPEYDASSGR